MKNWTKTLLPPTASIRKAIEVIETGSLQIAMIVDDNRLLMGTVTDGDIRRGILNGIAMTEPVSMIMQTVPFTTGKDVADVVLHEMMQERRLRQIPLVDDDGHVVGLVHIDDMTPRSKILDNWVVLMAGGLGERLQPLTADTPKPLLKVGDKPIAETILENLIAQDFRKFYISVNYMADMIKDHFGNGSRLGVEIRYMEEDKRLGTAGPLSLLPETPKSPLIVMNSDLLTGVDFNSLLSYHSEADSKATMCVREYDFQVPFGVVRIKDNQISRIDEKPVHKFFVNAGIYVLDPAILELIPKDTTFDMPELFNEIIGRNEKTAVFPIREYWLDVGRIDDLERAKREFNDEFGTS